MTSLRAGSASDVGLQRTNNEDQLLVADALWAVADGMGGHQAGEVASLTAVEALRANLPDASGGTRTTEELIEAIREANRAVWDRANERSDQRGMGTTLTAIALVEEDGEERLAVANVGDSRAYLLRNGEIEQLTEDHSVVEEAVREGRLSKEEAAVHPSRHMLTRVLGIGPDIDVDTWQIVPFRGDRLLLCSDGLSNELSDDDIASVLRRVADPDEAARELVSMANQRGGNDNITVVLVDVVDDDDRAAAASAALAGEPTRVQPTIEPGPKPESEERAAPPEQVPAPAAATAAPAGEVAPPERERRPARPRRPGRAVVAFVVILLLVVGVAVGAVAWYARGSYFVGLDRAQVVIYQGQPGGLLWFDPTIAQRFPLTEDDLLPAQVDTLTDGKEEPSLAAARRYVRNLEIAASRRRAEQAATTTTTTPFPPAPPAPPPP